MRQEEKAEKYDKIRDWLWDAAVSGNTFQSTIAAMLIHKFHIEGPNGEEPDEA